MISNVMTKISGLTKRLATIADERSERWDVLRMGVESAWAEIAAAFQTALGSQDRRGTDEQPRSTDNGHPSAA